MNALAEPARRRWLKALTIALWAVFIAGNFIIWLVLESAPFALSVVLLLLLFATEAGLLARYNRPLAQWRMLALAWLIYGLARITADRAASEAMSNGAVMLMLFALYAMAAGFAVLVILALRRDVSVTYFVLPFAVMPVLLLSMIRAAGGLIVLLWGPAIQPGELATFTWLEPLVMIVSCMIPLGFITFWGHLLRLLVMEQRSESLTALPARTDSTGTGR